MKKFIAIALALLTVFSFSTAAFAEGNTTTLTTTVPDATYTLNIPADQQITFGATSTDIGTVTVTNSSGFAEGKDLKVTLTYGDFKAEGLSTTIPYTLGKPYKKYNGSNIFGYLEYLSSGDYLLFKGNVSGKVNDHYELNETDVVDADKKTLEMSVKSTDWGKALGGEYTSTITFTAEVVSAS